MSDNLDPSNSSDPSEEIAIPFPETKSGWDGPVIRDDDTSSPDGENDNLEAESLSDYAHTATATAVNAMRGHDGDDPKEMPVAHALAVKAHQRAYAAMNTCGRNDEAALHRDMAAMHDHQQCRAKLAAKD